MGLRIVLMGTGEFAVPPFRAVLESDHQVLAVLTQPDRTGRGHHQHVNVVKQLAEGFGVSVLQPERVNRPEVLEQLRAYQADLFLVASYGQILKPELLAIPRLGAFNLHGSLLPRYRGAAPVQYAIWKGDQRTGVTIFRIEPALDSGPMVGRVETSIGEFETSGELMMRLAELSVPLTMDVLGRLEAGTAEFESQDVSQVVLSPKIPKEAGRICWQESCRAISCQIRAMQPWPKASSVLEREGQELVRCLFQQVQQAEAGLVWGDAVAEGSVRVHQGRPYVRAGDGWLEILKIQPEGRKAVDGRAFVNGYSLSAGAIFRSEQGAAV